jgi:Holliday junction resolvase
MLESYLQKLVNGGAEVEREYAEGRGAVDLCVKYQKKEYIIEVKIKGEDSLKDCIEQILKYLNINGEKEAWLVTFDRSKPKDWDKVITWETILVENGNIVTHNKKNKSNNNIIIHIVGC